MPDLGLRAESRSSEDLASGRLQLRICEHLEDLHLLTACMLYALRLMLNELIKSGKRRRF
jgi:hypothetical protein